MTAKPVVSDAMVSTAVDAALRHQVIAALVGDTGSSDISTLDGAVRELMGEHAELVRMVDRADARIAELEAENDAVDTGRPEALNALLSAVAASLPEQTVEERLDGAERAYRRARRVAVRSTRRVEGLIGAVDALTTQLAEARTRIVELEAERTSTARLINNAMRTQNDAPLAVEVLVNTFTANRAGLFRVERQRDEARAQVARMRALHTGSHFCVSDPSNAWSTWHIASGVCPALAALDGVSSSPASSPLDPDLTHPSWDEAVRDQEGTP